jgi:hypothetical protein
VNALDEQRIRDIARDVIALRRGNPPERPALMPGGQASFLLFSVFSGGDSRGGTCIIEPAVPCTHCGYCRSYGH